MTTKTYDKKPFNPDEFPDLNAGKKPFNPDEFPDLKKKGGTTSSKDVVEQSPTGTESTSPSKSFSLSGSPFDIEGIFRPGSERQKAIANLTSDLPKTIQTINNKVHFGDIKPEELSYLYNKEGGKEIVKSIVREYAPEIPEEYIGGSESLDLAAKNIFAKNRINFVNAEKNGVTSLDQNINNTLSAIKTPTTEHQAGTLAGYINEIKSGLTNDDYSNNDKVSGLISKIKRLQELEQRYYLGDDRNKSLAETQKLMGDLNNRLYYNISKTGVTSTLNQFDKQIDQAIIGKVIQSEMGTSESDVGADNEKVNHFKLGMTAVEKADPVLFNNVLNAIATKKQVSDTDFTNISRIGQEIANTMRFRGAAYDPNLKDTETDYDYKTFGQKVAETSAKIGEWAKSKGYKNRAEFSEKIIKEGAREVGENNQEVVNHIIFNEKLKGYDAIPKAGWVDDVVRGLQDPLVGINSTLSSWNESPAETYLRTKKFESNFGSQKVPDAKGVVSEELPSERDKFSTNMFRGLGQFVPQVLLTKGVGGVVGGVSGAAGIATSTQKAKNIADLAGTAISTFLQSYGPAYEEHLQKTGDAETSALVATIDGISSAGFETFILPDVKIADKAFRGLKQALATDLIGLIKKGGDPADLAKKARPFVEKFLTNATGTLFQEDLEEVGTQYVDFVTESIFDPASAKDRNVNKELWDTFKATSVSMLGPAILGAGGASLQKDFTTKTLHSAAINLDSYKESLQNSLDKGYMSQDEFNGAVQLISSHKESINAAPKQNINGNLITKEQQLDYAYEDTKIKYYQEKAKNTAGVGAEMWEAKIKESEDVQRQILMPKAGEKVAEAVVDPNERFKEPVVEETAAAVVAPQETKAESETTAEDVVPSTLKDEVFYHGTKKGGNLSNDKESSVTGNPTAGWGVFFTPDKKEAQRYVDTFHNKDGDIIEASLDLKKPYEMSFREYDDFVKLDLSQKDAPVEEQMRINTEKANEFKKELQSKGYDGIIIGVKGKARSQEVVAFDKSQIKQKTTPTNEAKTDSNVQTVGANEISQPIELSPFTPDQNIKEIGANEISPTIELTVPEKQKEPEPEKKPTVRVSAEQLESAQPERTISRVVPTVEPADKKGRTPVTLTGNTEQERQELIKRRKADTFVPTNVTDEQKLLERVNKFNKEGLRFKRSVRGRSELNNIKIAVDNYNKTHKQKYSAVQNRTGNLEFKNTKGDKVRTNNKVTGDLSIDDNGVPLINRSDKTKEVFNELLDRNLFPTGYTVDGRRMKEGQLDGAIQDILDGIPSRGANNYLDALEKMIEKNDFDFSTPDISQQEAITLEDITATEKTQQGDVMDEKAVEDFLNEQSTLTPEQEQIISDNIETLIDEYEIIGDTGQVQTPPEGSEGTNSTATEQNKVGEDEKTEAAKVAKSKPKSEGDGIKIIHEETAGIREEFSMPEYGKEAQTFEAWDEEADKRILNGEMPAVLDKLRSGVQPSAIEVRMMGKYIATLKANASRTKSNEDISKLHEAIQLSDSIGGTENARGLVARKGLFFDEGTLADFFQTELETAKVDVLTDEQKDVVEKEHIEITAAENKWNEERGRLNQKIKDLQAENELSKNKPKKPQTGTKKTHEDFVKERQLIVDHLKEKLRQARSGTNATIIPYANDLFAAAPDVARLVKSLVEEGITKLADVINNIHDVLKDGIPDITKDDVRDLVAGVYNEPRKTKTQVAKDLFELRLEAKLINQLLALENGEQPKTNKQQIEYNQNVKDLRDKIAKFRKENISDLDKLEALKNRYATEIKKVEEDLRTGKFLDPDPEPLPLKLDKEALDAKDNLIKLKNERQLRLIRQQYQNRPVTQKALTVASNILNVPRALMTTLDFSAVLRQGIIPTISHPFLAYEAGKQMFKSAWTQEAYDRWFFDLENSKRFDVMKESGLALTDNTNPNLIVREEEFMSNLAEKIPLVGQQLKTKWGTVPGANVIKKSERAYSAYLNKLRSDLFNRYAASMEDRGLDFENSPEQYKQMAEYINNATGRGSLGETLNKIAPLLNGLFFSPRLIASRLNMLTYFVQPRFYKSVPKEVRVAYFTDMAKFIAVGLSVLALAKYAGDDDDDDKKLTVESDPRSSDFGKIKQGNTRWDIWAGFQQFIRVGAQVWSGKRKGATGKMYDITGEGPFKKTRGDVLAAFARGKLAPVPSMAIDLFSGRTAIGDKILMDEWGSENEKVKQISIDRYLEEHLLPLTYTGIKEAYDEKGVKSMLTVGLPSVFGIGVQTYDAKKKK